MTITKIVELNTEDLETYTNMLTKFISYSKANVPLSQKAFANIKRFQNEKYAF